MKLLCLLLLFLGYGLPCTPIAQGATLHADTIASIEKKTLWQKALQEVVVEHISQKKSAVLPPQKMDAEQLKSLSSFGIADALRHFNGIQIKDYGGIGGLKTVNFRSLGSAHIGIFYDGVELGNAQNGMVDLSHFSLDPIESIEVYAGQKSNALQSAKDFGSSGSIYLRTRAPQRSAHRPTGLRSTLRSGSFGLFNPSLLWEQRWGARISSSVSGEWVQSTGNYPFRYRRQAPDGSIAYDTTAFRANGDLKALRWEGNLWAKWSFAEGHLKGYFYRNEQGIPGAIVSNVWRRGERMWVQNGFIQGVGRYTHERFRGLFTAKYADYRLRYVNNDWRTRAVDAFYRQQESYLSYAQNVQLSNPWSLSFAYDFMYHHLERNVSEGASPQRTTHLLAFSTQYHTPKWAFQGSLLATFVRDYAPLTHTPRYHALTPALFLSYTHPKLPTVRWGAFYKQSLRMPSFNDLYYVDIGNVILDPERTEQFNLSAEAELFRHKKSGSIDLKLDAYYNRVTDKIVAYPKGQQFRWTMINLGKVDIHGIDGQLSAHLLLASKVHWSSIVRYTYQSAIDISNPDTRYYRHQIPYTPKHSATWINRIKVQQWSFHYSILYTGERYNQRENIPLHFMSSWHTHDISICYTLPLSSQTEMTIQGECNNLLAQDYEVVHNYPMPLRNYKLSITINFL